MRRVRAFTFAAVLALPTPGRASDHACLTKALTPVGCGSNKAVVCYAPSNPSACVSLGYPYRAANIELFCADPVCGTAPHPPSPPAGPFSPPPRSQHPPQKP